MAVSQGKPARYRTWHSRVDPEQSANFQPKLSLRSALLLTVGLVLTFAFLLLTTPPIMTQTTHDQYVSEVEHRKRRTTKVAFIADAGLNVASTQVLRLIKNEGCDMVLHQGDLDYKGKTKEFYESIDQELGEDFPYFVSMGNYESKRGADRDVVWVAYQKQQRERMKKIKGLSCAVISMRNLACEYEGVSFVTSAIGVNASRLGLDLRELKSAQSALWGDLSNEMDTRIKQTWKFCSWHLPMIDFQVGFREGVPWMSSPKLVEAYEACRLQGAVVLTGHEHYYVRSHMIRKYSASAKAVRFQVDHVEIREKQSAQVSNDTHYSSLPPATFQSKKTKSGRDLIEMLQVGPGTSFAVVSGLGGHSVSVPSAKKIREFPHLSTIHPEHLITEKDPNGKMFYPEVTGANAQTTSNRIEAVVNQEFGYPFGALICVLQKSAVPRARGFCYFKTISGKVVDRFLLHRF